ncbi:hypothetical protein Hypma_003107 [Hypsizygus marmoreus]|uniref:Uncharacterized protein n=1 Tax=Hypsizygus marmoreus TaxID=39966 RepID=A0A369J6I0_HYPMA|nr:hypothetical protein Hypma_003107 [Hypsizygus marmoreus]
MSDTSYDHNHARRGPPNQPREFKRGPPEPRCTSHSEKKLRRSPSALTPKIVEASEKAGLDKDGRYSNITAQEWQPSTGEVEGHSPCADNHAGEMGNSEVEGMAAALKKLQMDYDQLCKVCKEGEHERDRLISVNVRLEDRLRRVYGKMRRVTQFMTFVGRSRRVR